MLGDEQVLRDRNGEEILYYENFNLEPSFSPINTEVFCNLLKQSNYDPAEIEFLQDGLENGFDIGYEGDQNVKLTAPNLRLIMSRLMVK